MGERIHIQEQQTTPSQRLHRRTANLALWICALTLLAALTVPAVAQSSRVYREGNAWVEEISGKLPSARELHVTTDWGSVQVEGNAAHVSYIIRKRCRAATKEDARRQFELLRVSAMKSGDADAIEGKATSKDLGLLGADFVIEVPREVNLVKVDTRGGALWFSSLAAAVLASTSAGVIRLDDLTGPVKISSGGGNVIAGNVGSKVTSRAAANELHLDGPSPAPVSIAANRRQLPPVAASMIQTGAGTIQVRKCMGNLFVSSGGGNLYLGDVEGAVEAQTQAGSVRLASAGGAVRVSTGGGSVELHRLSRGAQVETGAGPITVEFLGDHGFTESFLHTAAGDVTVCFPADMRVDVHASSDMATGDGVASDFPAVNIMRRGGVMMPLSVFAEGALNGGGPALRIRTTIGQIALRKCP